MGRVITCVQAEGAPHNIGQLLKMLHENGIIVKDDDIRLVVMEKCEDCNDKYVRYVLIRDVLISVEVVPADPPTSNICVEVLTQECECSCGC